MAASQFVKKYTGICARQYTGGIQNGVDYIGPKKSDVFGQNAKHQKSKDSLCFESAFPTIAQKSSKLIKSEEALSFHWKILSTTCWSCLSFKFRPTMICTALTRSALERKPSPSMS